MCYQERGHGEKDFKINFSFSPLFSVASFLL